MSIGTTAIELRVFKKKKKKKTDKMGKTFLGVIFTFGALLLRFLVYCLVFNVGINTPCPTAMSRGVKIYNTVIS